MSKQVTMEGFVIEVPLYKLKESLIIKYFFDEVKESLIKLAICNHCLKPIVFSADNYKHLAAHLKLHPESWDQYLQDLASAIKTNVLKTDGLKLSTLILDEESEKAFSLSLPVSRTKRNFRNQVSNEVLTEFQSRLKNQYNACPVGRFAGPYDQNEALPLSIQLPDADINFDQYTQFRHPDDVDCKGFAINDKDSYEKIVDLAKIDALNVCGDEGTSDEEENELDDKIIYTCQKNLCRIPCPCSPCFGEEQCTDHRLRHEELFDDKNDMLSIRSSEKFCTDQAFFDKSYLIKYPGIPIDCERCKRNYLHHICYHFELHENCKFCRKNRFKTYATTRSEFVDVMKNNEGFLKSVCPHCDNTFCEPHFRKKHIELEHGESSKFTCDFCPAKFHAKQSKEYHQAVHHSDDKFTEKCNICGKEFSAKVTLMNHVKYVHSDNRDHPCTICEKKFKQRKDMRTHMLNIHGINMYKAMYGNFECQDRFDCDMCDATFKYKKGLNAHVRLKHENTSGKPSSYTCDICPSVFKELKTLTSHKKLKHSESQEDFPCQICGKTFNQKKNLKRHEKTHEAS